MTLSDYSLNTGPIALFANHLGNAVNTYQEMSMEGWNTRYFPYFNSTYVTTGGYYVYSESAQDVLIQIISDSTTIRIKHYGGSDIDYGRDLEILPDSGFLIVGTTNSFGAGDYDVYIIRTDKNGDSLWTRTYGAVQDQFAYGVEKENDSVYVVAGSWGNQSSQSMDIFIMKINLEGDTISFKLNATNILDEWCYSLCKTNDGGYMVAGSKTIPMSTYYAFMFYMEKYDANLNKLWSKYYGDIYDNEAMDVKECYDHGFIMVGYSEQPNRGKDVYIVRTDSVGDTLWTRTLGGLYDDQAYSVVQTPDSGFAIVGNTYSYGAGGSDAFFLKLKPSGETTVSFGLPVENRNESFRFFPNPATNFITIEVQSNITKATEIKIYNALGKLSLIETFEKGINIKSINLKSLSQGIYIIELRDEYGIIGNRKLIKE